MINKPQPELDDQINRLAFNITEQLDLIIDRKHLEDTLRSKILEELLNVVLIDSTILNNLRSTLYPILKGRVVETKEQVVMSEGHLLKDVQ